MQLEVSENKHLPVELPGCLWSEQREGGVEDLLAAFVLMKRCHPDTLLVIGGQGISSDGLKQVVQEQNIPDVIFTDSVSNNEKRALMQLSNVGVIPTKPILNFVETLCISALEYQARGHPSGQPSVLPYPNPASRARMTACARSATCSLLKMLETWLRTVLRVSPN